MDDFEGCKTSVEEVTADGMDIAGEPAREVEPEDGTISGSDLNKMSRLVRMSLLLVKML